MPGIWEKTDTYWDVLLVLVEGVPTNADALPTFAAIGRNGQVAGGTVTHFKEGAVTGATNASPIVITSNGHELATGMLVTISGVLGNTAANGTFVVTRVSPGTFSLNGSTGNGEWTSGGEWVTTGRYLIGLALTNFQSGQDYTVIASYAMDATDLTQQSTFQVG